MVNTSQICLRVDDWLAGKSSFAEFADWFIPETWNAYLSKDAESEALVDEIELRISEYSSGYLSGEMLRSELEELAKRPFLTSIGSGNTERLA